MKILIVYTAVSVSDNPFVRILAEGLRTRGHDVSCSVRDFWHHPTAFDIVHLQWPEEAFGWKNPDQRDVEALARQLAAIHDHGIPIVYTRHNTRPHHTNALIEEAYRLYEQRADAVAHMGEFSKQEFTTSHAAIKQIQRVIPHHIYEGYYNFAITREQGRQRLNIPADAFVILAFGAFRHADERWLVWGAFRRLVLREKLLLAPRFCPYTLHGTRFRGIKRILNYAIYFAVHLAERWLQSRLTSTHPMIDDGELAYYLAAADMLLVQRTGILNSGNVPLGLSFGRVVAGPSCGNIGGLLTQTGNPTFDPHDPASVDHALQEAVRLVKEGHGEKNRDYAQQHFSIACIAEQYDTLYQELHDANRR